MVEAWVLTVVVYSVSPTKKDWLDMSQREVRTQTFVGPDSYEKCRAALRIISEAIQKENKQAIASCKMA